jgi:hypothetical protein
VSHFARSISTRPPINRPTCGLIGGVGLRTTYRGTPTPRSATFIRFRNNTRIRSTSSIRHRSTRRRHRGSSRSTRRRLRSNNRSFRRRFRGNNRSTLRGFLSPLRSFLLFPFHVDEPEPAEDNHTAKNQQARWDLQNPTSIAEQNEGETRELGGARGRGEP